MGKYKIQHDSLVTPTKAYKIDILDKDLINLISEDDTIHMERINDGKKTIDFYINNGYFNRDFSDTIRKKAIASFVDSIFIIREVDFKIKQEIEHRDSLINYWESELKSDSANKTTYEYLIKKINKN